MKSSHSPTSGPGSSSTIPTGRRSTLSRDREQSGGEGVSAAETDLKLRGNDRIQRLTSGGKPLAQLG
jgi:hypothetical protein